MNQAALLKRIDECRALRDQTHGQERTRYGFELWGLQAAGGYQEAPTAEQWAMLDRAYRHAYQLGKDNGETLLKLARLNEQLKEGA